MPTDFEDIKRQLLSGKKKPNVLPFGQGLSTGSTLLNLALTGNPLVGIPLGGIYLIVGDSRSGKTFLSLTSLAEASLDPKFTNYRFIFDNPEHGANMDLAHYFGKKMADRIEPPECDGSGRPVYSTTSESLYYHLDDAFEEGKPFIYVIDSMDALSSDEEQGKFLERKQAHRKGKQAAGSYGTGKARVNSANLRVVNNRLPESGSVVILISQTRANLGFGHQEKTRSGGLSLRFFAQWEFWSSVVGKIEREYNGRKRQIGSLCKLNVVKNRFTGWEGSIRLPIYRKQGIDDLGSMVEWLIDEGHWTKSGANVSAAEFDHKGSRDKLIAKIEDEGREEELRQLVAWVWQEIELASVVQRKKRYE